MIRKATWSRHGRNDIVKELAASRHHWITDQELISTNGIGRLCSWDRSSAGGLAVLFAGVGFFCGTAGAMATEIGIPFAGVQVLCGGVSGVASEVWVQSAGVGPTFCVTGCTTNISGVLSDFSGTTTFFKDFAGAPSDGICIDNGWAWHLDIYDE
ncbi:uncharacterized protein [Aegilops tauschii subsp. strangulata]|uniref:uncharacterized protein n=1 Tax=Aegilops tauschii subsp. strangulata TaxID=200361 RepID=UPI003CC8693F